MGRYHPCGQALPGCSICACPWLFFTILMMSHRRILLADDEPYITSVLAAKLQQRGDQVAVAGNGDEALTLALEDPPTLIITDYQMPLLSGYEMCVKLKQDPRTATIPVVMLTARGHHLTPEQLALTNIRALIAKPFSAREVLARVDELMEPPAAAPLSSGGHGSA